MSTMMVTGHRPDKLSGGYNCMSEDNLALRKKLYDAIAESGASDFISGGALGIDQFFALEVIHYRKDNPDKKITLEIAVPCQKHESRWLKESVDLYNFILSRADKVTLVTDKPYAPALMQIRNEYMVDHADLVLAVWNGSAGGTANCVKYAKKQKKTIQTIKP